MHLYYHYQIVLLVQSLRVRLATFIVISVSPNVFLLPLPPGAEGTIGMIDSSHYLHHVFDILIGGPEANSSDHIPEVSSEPRLLFSKVFD